MAKKKREPKPNKEYTLEPCNRKHDYRILACDPGKRNFGIACVGVKDGKPDVIANAMLTNPITTFTNGYLAQRRAFSKELRRWFDLYEPDLVIAERFQTRGNGGPTIELVSAMNMLVGLIRADRPVKYIPASQWKVAFNRRWGDDELKSMYEDCLTLPHPLDASLIGVYGLEYALQQQLSYKPETIIEQVEASSRMELRRPRK
jgi:hypothetical protein